MDGDDSSRSLARGPPSDPGPASGPYPVPADQFEPGSEAGAHVRPRKFVIQSTFGVPRERRSRKSRPCDSCRRRKTACIITTEPPWEAALARTYGNFDHVAPAGHGDREQVETTASPDAATSSPHVVASSPSGSVPGDYSSSRFGHEAPLAAYPSYGLVRDPRDPHIKAEPVSAVMSMDIVQPALNSPESSGRGSAAAAVTLEDNPGRSTYYLGRTAEQDAFVLDAFSYGILSETSTVDANVVQIHRGGPDVDDLPQHFLFLSLGHPKHTNLSREEASDAIETKVWPHADVLVRLYFKHIHPVLPLMSKVRFLRRYASNRKSIPACLRGAVYALASVFWTEDPTIPDGDCPPFHQHEIVDQAHRALRREIENPNLFVVQACLLLIHVQPPSIDSIEAPSTFTLAAQATACAQLIGLHQDPTSWNVEPVEKRLRRKLWWSVFVTDCWAAISVGSSPHIGEASFNTMPMEIEDIRCDEDVPDDLRYLVELQNAYFDVASGARFLEYIKMTRHLRTVLDCSFQVNPKNPSPHGGMAARDRLADVHLRLKDWPTMIPSCLVVPENRDPLASCYN
ncbi:hypothetical protein E4U41_004810, partial [Claviceps citrina]